MVKTGVIDFIGTLVSATGMFELAFPLALLLYLLFAYGIFTLCPVGGVWEALFVPVLAGFCVSSGVSPRRRPVRYPLRLRRQLPSAHQSAEHVLVRLRLLQVR